MSGVMLHSILNMPPDLWQDGELDKMARYSAYMRASRRIKALEDAIRETIEANLHLADGKNCTLIKLKIAIDYD